MTACEAYEQTQRESWSEWISRMKHKRPRKYRRRHAHKVAADTAKEVLSAAKLETWHEDESTLAESDTRPSTSPKRLSESSTLTGSQGDHTAVVSSVQTSPEQLQSRLGDENEEAWDDTEMSTMTLEPSDLEDRQLTELALEQSLRQVRRAIEMDRQPLSSLLQHHLSNIQSVYDFDVDASWTLQYVVPLLAVSTITSANHLQCFDESCALLSRLSQAVPATSQTAQILETDVLQILLAVNRDVSVYAQIAFETVLRILTQATDCRQVLRQLVTCRTSGRGFYEASLVPFRCMRAEYLRVLLCTTTIDLLLHGDLQQACIAELTLSYAEEPSNEVRNRYHEVLADYATRVPTKALDIEIKPSSRAKWEETKEWLRGMAWA